MSWKVAGLVAFAFLPACPPSRGRSVAGCSSCHAEPGDASIDAKAQGGDGITKPTLKAPATAATGHPRLFVRESDLARLRSWATPANPVWESGLKALADTAAKAMDAGSVTKEDPGSSNGFASYPTETYAMLFAFMSLVDPVESARTAWSKRARTLLISVIEKAEKGAAEDKPFRDPRFSVGDRSRWSGEGFPLTVDWIYGSLSADDKKRIRAVFLRWASEIQKAEVTTDNHPEPPGIVNDPKLTADVKRTRWSGNNYYTAHMRNLGLMAMSFDAADDPDEKLRSHLLSVTGAWLYVSEALMNGDMRGGLAAEGFEYSPQAVGYVAQLLLALYTAGRSDAASYGRQVTFDNPFWSDAIPGFLHSLSPIATVSKDDNFSYLGPLHQVAWYGDGQKYWAPDYMGVFGPLGVHAQYTKNDTRWSQLRWIETNYAPGGATKLASRASDNGAILDAIFYFLLLDPKAAAPADPRPQYPLSHFSVGLGRYLQRTSWTADATWFSYKLGWVTLDHQHADGNMFELWRKGEWLTKERTGYGDDIACTDQKNGIALQNDPPGHKDGYRGAEFKRGSQWTYVTDGDGQILNWRSGPDFTYFLGDASLLYNSKYEKSTDILYSTRSIVWLVPDRIVVYDRAASKSAGHFKRFWMQLPAAGRVENGLMTMRSAGGQNLYVRTLLPEGAKPVVEPAESLTDDNGRQPAQADPIKFRLKVEAPGAPKVVRWLHAIQGADGKDAADPATLIKSSAGTPFEGTSTHDTVVMFPVDIPITFASLTYSAPASTKAHLITGLAPGAGYNVSTQKNGDSVTMTITPGGGQKADSGGVLTVGKLP